MVRYSFPNKVVLVTGSSRGMGAAILEGFAAAGATCIVNYFADADGHNRRDADETAERLRRHGVPVHVFDADVSQYDAVAGLMKRIADTCGGLDILVNNAGILRDRTVKKMTPGEWQSVLQTNLDGVFYCSKLGAEMLRDGGRIVNIASIAGSGRLSRPGQLRGGQGRRHRPDESAGQGTGSSRHHGQRRRARRHSDADAGRPQAGSARRIREANPRRPRRPAGRSRPCRAVLRLRESSYITGKRSHHRRLVLVRPRFAIRQ